MKPARLLLLALAVGMVPFALASYNGATLLGAAAATTLIVLTIKDATPRKDSRS